MKKLFWETKLYDYSSLEECAKHIDEMVKKGWFPDKRKPEQRVGDTGHEQYVYKNGADKYPYSVEFYKQGKD